MEERNYASYAIWPVLALALALLILDPCQKAPKRWSGTKNRICA